MANTSNPPMDASLIKETTDFIVYELRNTPLGKSFDITSVKAKITDIFNDIFSKLDKTSNNNILIFVKNSKLFQQCIIPNIIQICADNQINLNDIPNFIDIIFGVYSCINDFVQENPTITISSNNLIELSGLLLKATLVIVVTNPIELNMALAIVNSTIKLVKLSVKNKNCSCKLLCCLKPKNV